MIAAGATFVTIGFGFFIFSETRDVRIGISISVSPLCVRRPGTGRPRPLPRWLKWILRRLKVKLTDVTVRYESVGMCPLQVRTFL